MNSRAVHVACLSLGLALAACTSDTSSTEPGPVAKPAPTQTPAPTPTPTDTPTPDPKPTPDAEPSVVLIRGTLAADAAASKAKHDALAGAAQAKAKSLGDIGHYTFVGAQDERAFLSIDRWTSLAGLEAFFEDKDVVAGFSTFYTAPPKVTPYRAPKGWATWGDIDYRKYGKVTAVTVRGHLASTDQAVSKKVHDDAAGGVKSIAQGLGDVGHNVHVGVADPRDFMTVDYWTDPKAIADFYANPDFQAALSTLFDGPPEVTIQVSTDWVQW